GTAISLGSTVTDPSSVDQAAGFTFAWSVTKNGAATATATALTFGFTPDDNGTYVVHLTVTDKDLGVGTALDQTISVYNVAPVVSISGAPANAPEGSAISLGSIVSDPSSVDQATGFGYSWSVTKNGAVFASGSGAGFSFTPDDNGTYV